MSASSHIDVSAILSEPEWRQGPGGAVAVLRDGHVAAKTTWGYANLERRIPMSAKTLLPICSISKQMVCLVLIDVSRKPTTAIVNRGVDFWDQLSSELRELLPNLEDRPTVTQLCNMQSGIRDYWAETVLWGAHPEGEFSIINDGPQALERTRSLHFASGSQMSYSNVNFFILARALENVSGQSIAQLLTERVFIPAGMSTAALCANTSGHPLPIIGYEGDDNHGYRPAVNRIEWAGDAGIVASLEDMIAYEAWLDESWKDENSLYRTIAQPQHYNDGTTAPYGFGLVRSTMAGKTAISHMGALRGFRLIRAHIPSERLSVVVMFNHEADPAVLADRLTRQALRYQEPSSESVEGASTWEGSYLDERSQLLLQVDVGNEGHMLFTSGSSRSKVKLLTPHRARSKSFEATLDGDVIEARDIVTNRTLRAYRIATRPEMGPTRSEEIAGEYHSADIDSTFHCSVTSGVAYAMFDGWLGKGPAHTMRHVGQNIWIVHCRRSLDAPAPGEWTVVFRRDENGAVIKVTIGCPLAKQVEYVRRK